jgi:exodeoxyribonuclease V alpha subunit
MRLNPAPFDLELMVTSQIPGNRGSQIIHGLHNGKIHSVIARSYVLSRSAQPGEYWLFTGEWDTNPNYINQVIASHGEPISVDGERLKQYIVRHPKLRVGEGGMRIGEKTWLSAITEAQGPDQLAQLIESEDRAGIRALGVGRLTHNIELVLHSWSILQGELKSVKLLAKHQIGKRLSNRLIRQYGETLPEVLNTDCYKILAYERNTTSLFSRCEKMADSMNYAADDPRRLQGAVDFILNYRLDKFGHTAIEPDTLITALVRHFKDDFIAKQAIDLALGTGALQESPEGLLQSRPCAHAEATVEKRFVTMIKHGVDNTFGKRLSEQAEQVYAMAENPKKNNKIKLTDEQKRAIQLPFQQQLSIITGGAGTGKTTVISSVARLAQALNLQVFEMALSGQAADVMRGYNEEHDIDCLSRTIHYYILPFENAEEADKEHRGGNYRAPEEFPADCLVIIDEASMVDLSLMNRLLRHLPETARIVMVGDSNQIPPVGAGLVFHLLCNSKNVPIAKLIKPHRSAAATGIPAISKSISLGVVPDLDTFDLTDQPPEQGVFFLPTAIDRNDPHSLAKIIFDVASKLGLDKTQVITTHRKSANAYGPIVQSIYHINSYFQSQLTTGKATELKAWGLNEGDPVIVRKNVTDVGGNGFDLFNGSLGSLSDATEPYSFEFGNEERVLYNDDIAKLGIILGYALTVHSFQGSAAECVIIAVTKSNILERSLLYTALTRAKKTVVFVGDQKAFNEAIEAPPKWQTIQTGFSVDRSFEKQTKKLTP